MFSFCPGDVLANGGCQDVKHALCSQARFGMSQRHARKPFRNLLQGEYSRLRMLLSFPEHHLGPGGLQRHRSTRFHGENSEPAVDIRGSCVFVPDFGYRVGMWDAACPRSCLACEPNETSQDGLVLHYMDLLTQAEKTHLTTK